MDELEVDELEFESSALEGAGQSISQTALKAEEGVGQTASWGVGPTASWEEGVGPTASWEGVGLTA